LIPAGRDGLPAPAGTDQAAVSFWEFSPKERIDTPRLRQIAAALSGVPPETVTLVSTNSKEQLREIASVLGSAEQALRSAKSFVV